MIFRDAYGKPVLFDEDIRVHIPMSAPALGLTQTTIDRYRVRVLQLAQGYVSDGSRMDFSNLARACKRESLIEVSAESGDVAAVVAYLAGDIVARGLIVAADPWLFNNWDLTPYAPVVPGGER